MLRPATAKAEPARVALAGVFNRKRQKARVADYLKVGQDRYRKTASQAKPLVVVGNTL